MNFTKFSAAMLCGLVAAFGLVNAQASEEEIVEFNEKSYAEVAPIEGRCDTSAAVPLGEHMENTMITSINSVDAKIKMMQSMMAANPMSVRDMMSMMVAKKSGPARADI